MANLFSRDFIRHLFGNRALLAVGLGRGMQIVIAMASLRLITAFLSPAEAGRRFVLLSLTAFFALILINPIGMYINRKTHQWVADGSLYQKLNLFWGLLVGIAAIAFACLFVLDRTVGIGVDTPVYWLLVLTSGSLLVNTGNVTLTTLLNMIDARVAYVVTTTLTLLLGLLASIALAIGVHATAEYWLLGTLIGQAVVMFAAYLLLKAKIKPTPSGPLQLGRMRTYAPIFAFTWPLSIAVGLNWVQTQSYRFVLTGQAGLHALGLFATGYGISAAIMSAFESLFQQYYSPIYYREVASGEARTVAAAWNTMMAYMLPPLLLVEFFLVAASPFLIRLMVSSAFQGVEAYLLWGAAAELARILGNAYSLLAHARLQMRTLLWPNVIGALVATGTIWLGNGHVEPAFAVGLGLTLAGFAVLASLHRYYTRSLPLSIAWGTLPKSFGLALPMLVLGVALHWVWRNPTAPQAGFALLLLGGLLGVVLLLVARQNVASGPAEAPSDQSTLLAS